MDGDAVIAAIFLSLLSIIITVFIMRRQGKSQAQPTQPHDNSKNTQTHGGYYNRQEQAIKVDGCRKLTLGPEIKPGGSCTIEPSSEKHVLDKSQAQPTQPQDNSKNTQTGGGYYNPQVQGTVVGGGGKINLGPEIKGGGSFTINSSSEKHDLGNRLPVGPTNEAEPTKGTQNTQTGGGLYNPQFQASTIGGTVSLGPVVDNGSFNLNPSPEIKNGGTVVGVPVLSSMYQLPKAHYET